MYTSSLLPAQGRLLAPNAIHTFGVRIFTGLVGWSLLFKTGSPMTGNPTTMTGIMIDSTAVAFERLELS